MKKLILVRHAQAADFSAQGDFQRILTGKGKKDASKVAKHLKEIGCHPDQIFTSNASRALETAQIFHQVFPTSKFTEVEDLYLYNSSEQLITFIRQLPNNLDEIVIVGHNPYLKDTADELYEKAMEWFPKSGALGLSFNVENWKDIKAKSGRINFFTHPKEFIYLDFKSIKKKFQAGVF